MNSLMASTPATTQTVLLISAPYATEVLAPLTLLQFHGQAHSDLAVSAVEDQRAVGKSLEVRGVYKLLTVHGQVWAKVLGTHTIAEAPQSSAEVSSHARAVRT